MSEKEDFEDFYYKTLPLKKRMCIIVFYAIRYLLYVLGFTVLYNNFKHISILITIIFAFTYLEYQSIKKNIDDNIAYNNKSREEK